MKNLTSDVMYQKLGENIIGAAWQWYDFICPFCYVSKGRSKILEHNGFTLISLPFQIHPEVPTEGLYVGDRKGSMYDLLEKEAREADLPLKWPLRLPNSRYALEMAEQVRRHSPELFPNVRDRLFAAHFALGEDIGSKEVVNNCLKESGIKAKKITNWIINGFAFKDLKLSESVARNLGVPGTPAWIVEGRLISGLQPTSFFERVTVGSR
jgi:predicted DsbA family dithiol-disulfide isomerase